MNNRTTSILEMAHEGISISKQPHQFRSLYYSKKNQREVPLNLNYFIKKLSRLNHQPSKWRYCIDREYFRLNYQTIANSIRNNSASVFKYLRIFRISEENARLPLEREQLEKLAEYVETCLLNDLEL